MKHEKREEAGGTRLLFQGDIDMHAAPELREVLRKALEKRPPVLIVDLAGVPFIDSSGVATIVEALKRARKGFVTLRIDNLSEAVRDTFDIAGLTKILGII